MYVCIHIYIYIHTHTYIYTHTYINNIYKYINAHTQERIILRSIEAQIVLAKHTLQHTLQYTLQHTRTILRSIEAQIVLAQHLNKEPLLPELLVQVPEIRVYVVPCHQFSNISALV